METIKTQTYDYGEQLGTLPTVRRAGYELVGWFTKNGTDTNNWGDIIGSATVVRQNATYYAKWSPIEYTIHYDKNGFTGTLPESLLTKYTIEDSTYYPQVPEVIGEVDYEIFGWQPECKPTNCVGDITFTLNWKQIDKYTITWDSCMGTEVPPSQYTHGQEIGTLPSTERIGHSFDGWYTLNVGG